MGCATRDIKIMKKAFWITVTALMAVTMSSCSSLFTASTYESDDLYTTDNRIQIANRLKAQAEAEAAEAAARQAQWEARTAEAYANAAEAEYYAAINDEPNYVNIVADNYESAYARRLYGFNSATYNYPSSYFSLRYSDAMRYASAYDPAYYNIMVSGNQVWVEPRYVTSMFGSWGATNITYGIYSSPWNYGWYFNVDPFYYSWWGYPRYSWYDWNWNVCYNPHHYYDWWYGYPYYGYNHHHHYHPGHHYYPQRPPQHRPKPDGPTHNRPNHNLTTGSGGGAGRPVSNLNGTRDNSGSRYTSPTSNRNYGKVDNTTTRPGRGGSVSTGINSNSNYRVSNTKVDIPTTTAGGAASTTVRNNNTRNNGSAATTTTNASRSNNYRQGGSKSTQGSSSSSYRSSSSSNSSSSSYRNSSSSTHQSVTAGSSSSYRSNSSGSSSRSSSSSSSSSRSGGGSTSSRR